MLGDECLDRQRRATPDRLDEIIGPRENTVGVINGDLAQMLDQERAAGLAGDAIGFRVKRPRVKRAVAEHQIGSDVGRASSVSVNEASISVSERTWRPGTARTAARNEPSCSALREMIRRAALGSAADAVSLSFGAIRCRALGNRLT
jgi:hypothetical protein